MEYSYFSLEDLLTAIQALRITLRVLLPILRKPKKPIKNDPEESKEP